MKYLLMMFGDVASEARAVEIASRVVAFIEAPVEVRPVPAGPPEA